MNALITGISGFVGSHLAEHLLQAGDRVLGATRDGRWLPHFQLPVPLVAWNLAEEEPEGERLQTFEAFAPDVIYHLAAWSIPADCGGTGEPTVSARQLNVDGVRRVLQLAAALRSRPRVLFTSSSHVYGAVDPAQPVVAETATCAPRSAYGRTKLAAEQICRRAMEQGADVVVVRSFSQAGPRQDARLMLAEWARQFAVGAAEIEVGNLHVAVDMLDVRDAVRALRALALHGASGAVYNVGSGTSHTTGEWFCALQRAVGVSRPVYERDARPRRDPIADIDRLRAAVAWSPAIPLEQTAADVWTYWRERTAAERRQSQQQQQ